MCSIVAIFYCAISGTKLPYNQSRDGGICGSSGVTSNCVRMYSVHMIHEHIMLCTYDIYVFQKISYVARNRA